MNLKLSEILFTILFLALANLSFAQPSALIIKTTEGKEVITDGDRSVVGSGAMQIRPVGAAEGYVFSNKAAPGKKYPPAQKIFTGVYSSHSSEESRPVDKDEPVYFSPMEPDLEVAVGDAKPEGTTLAWVTKEADFFHDPFLECGSHTSRIWIKKLDLLGGVEPCPECFFKTSHAPEFIIKESGGLDLATAGALLDNPGFLSWLEQNLPVKKAVFLTSRKLLIYPKMEMTSAGLKELAHEAAMAYRRHTWKVIEVLAKKNETDLENISSY